MPVLPATDFADWLSPMLVKELRQGVRTRVFVSLLILLQVLLLVDVSLSLLVASVQEDASTGTVFFWLIVGLPVLLVLPLNGLNAISGEIKANTLELIFLTRLSAFRIVVGKWLAILAQCLLLVSTVLPYLVLRYFIGGINLTNELVTLGLLLTGAVLLAAASTGLSAYSTRVIRPLAGLVVPFFLIFGVGTFSSLAFRGGSSSPPPGTLDILALLACGVLLVLLMLRMGAYKIAPPAENHAGVARLIALLGFGLAVAANFLLRDASLISGITEGIAVFVCAGALCEEPRWIPSIYRPFARRGFVGRAAGTLFYPGWPSGVLFSLVIFTLYGVLLTFGKTRASAEHELAWAALAGALLLPVALTRAVLPKTKKATMVFCLVQLASVLVTLFSLVCDSVLKTHLKNFFAWLPVSALIMVMGDSDSKMAALRGGVLVTALLSAVALLVVSRLPLVKFRLMEKESLLSPGSVSPVAPVPSANPDATLA